MNESNAALSAITGNGKFASAETDHLLAYALYKAGNYKESIDRINKCIDLVRKNNGAESVYLSFLHMLAQTYYKSGQYEKAADVYESMTSSDDPLITTQKQVLSNEEYVTNLLAAYCSGGFLTRLHDFVVKAGLLDILTNNTNNISYEVLFNYGCALISGGAYESGLDFVKTAIRMIQEQVSEDDSLLSELHQMQLAYGFALQQSGDTDLAKDTYSNILRETTSGDAMNTLVEMNLLTLQSEDNVKASTVSKLVEKVSERMTLKQQTTLRANEAIALAWDRQGAEARTKIHKLVKACDLSSVQVAALMAFSYLREKHFTEADAELAKGKGETARDIAMLDLTKVQVLLAKGHASAAYDLFTTLTSPSGSVYKIDSAIPLYPATLIAKLSILDQMQQVDVATKVLDTYLATYTTENQQLFEQVRLFAANWYSEHAQPTKALQLLEALYGTCTDSSRKKVISAHIYSLVTKLNPESAAAYAHHTPEVDVSHIATADLLSSGIQAISRKFGAANDDVQYLNNGKRKFSSEKLQKVRELKKQKKQTKLPKNVTPEEAAKNLKKGFTPDQYRWLPKWKRPVPEKAGKGAKNAGKAHKGPQGSGLSENKIETNVIPTASKLKGGRRRR